MNTKPFLAFISSVKATYSKTLKDNLIKAIDIKAKVTLMVKEKK